MAEKEVHLRDYLAIIRKHDFFVVVSFLLIFGSALIVSLYMPRIYEASAMIEVQSTTTSSGLSNLVQNVVSRGVDQISMETICKRFVSRSLLAEAISNLEKRMPNKVEARSSVSILTPDTLAPKIRPKIIPDTRMIEVTVRMRRDEGGSQHAARIANELISVMQSQRSMKTDAEVERRREFVDSKIDDIMSRIENSDQGIREFLRDSGDDLVWSARVDYVMARLSNLVEFREESKTLLATERKKLDELKARLEEEPEWMEYSRTYARDPLLDRYRATLTDLQRQLVAARVEFGEEHARVKTVEAQIGRIEDEMRDIAQEVMSAKTESQNPTYQTLLNYMIAAELNVIAYEARREGAEEELSKLNAEVEKIFSEMPEQKFRLDKMRREAGYKVDIYKVLLEKRLDAEIWANENSDDSSGRVKGGIEIVDKAQPGSRPISPRVKFIGAIAGLVGLAVGLAMAFLAEYFENTYQSLEEAKEDLDIPVLGIIPFIKDQQTLQHGTAGTRNTVPIPILESPMSAEAESFRTLATNIEFSSPDQQLLSSKALLITSSGANEGKSFAAANLAVAMAQTKEQVILIDCDMRKAVQHKIFGADNQVGLANLLVGNADLGSVIQDTDIPNLKLISCGPMPPNPVELLKSHRMDEILNELRGSCNAILCDSPPVLPVADALVLASKLDGVLFVADLNRTPREVIRQAREQLSKLDVPLFGLICNRVGTAKYDSYYYRPRKSLISIEG